MVVFEGWEFTWGLPGGSGSVLVSLGLTLKGTWLEKSWKTEDSSENGREGGRNLEFWASSIHSGGGIDPNSGSEVRFEIEIGLKTKAPGVPRS